MPTKNDILREVFGFTSFRKDQETVVDATLAGRDALAVLPTGGGKSLCYQIPALMPGGTTFVISPLISLMIDQVGALRQSGVAAAYLNSTLSMTQYRKALANAAKGMYRIIYIAPERLVSPEFMAFARYNPPERIAVDEAHCVSQWGRDFRPSYLAIKPFIDSLPIRPTLAAFTATATSKVRDDIVSLLGLSNPVVTIGSFDRPNLYFDVIRGRGGHTRDERLADMLDNYGNRSGIIYCSTRRAVDDLHQFLLDRGFNAGRYHAGMPDADRRKAQDDFASDITPILIATNAFGMGIDKSNVSYIIHYNMPGDLESYYQEAGRAGRDGSSADCILLFSPADIITRKNLIEHSDEAGDGGAVERALLRLNDMIAYASSSRCLRRRLLNYFGEEHTGDCGRCGNCGRPSEQVDFTETARTVFTFITKSGGNYALRTLRQKLTSKRGQDGSDRYASVPGFASLAHLSANRVDEILGVLAEDGYLIAETSPYFRVTLTRRAHDVISGAPCMLTLPVQSASDDDIARDDTAKKRHTSRSKRNNSATGYTNSSTNDKAALPAAAIRNNQPKHRSAVMDISLLDALKALRRSIALDIGKPAYIVFSDASLEDMCRKHPLTPDEMLQVSGVGLYKLTEYGRRFIEEIKRYDIENLKNKDIENNHYGFGNNI